jgi:hypothetical protein
MVRVPIGASAILLVACGRVYRPVQPIVTTSPVLNATVSEVTEVAVPARLVVVVLTSAIERVRLRGAKLVDLREISCSKGIDFDRIERDGRLEREGPLDIEQSHELRFEFGGPEVARLLQRGHALDIEIEGPLGRSCTRVMLPAHIHDAQWRSEPTGVGFYTAVGVRTYPAVSQRIDWSAPGVSVDVRFGASFEKSRVSAGAAVDTREDVPGERFQVFDIGFERAVLQYARLSLWLGAGYDLVLDFRDTGAKPFPLRHVLHGPQITPGLACTLLQGDLPFGAYPRPLILRLSLDAPQMVWFGSGDVPKATVVSVFALALTLDM